MAKDKIDINYIKSNSFMIHHIDGIHGGITPNGYLGINFFSETFPIPERITHELLKNKIGKELARESKEGIVRQLECGVIMSIETAKSINKWLNNKINEFESISAKGKAKK